MICSYCDFYKMVAKPSLQTEYIDHLIKELELKKPYLKDIQTIYIGGGTPTALPLHLLDFLFYYLHQNIDFTQVKEFTIEGNPNDITEELTELLVKWNVNRVSLGVQTLHKEKLKFLNRSHHEKEVRNAVALLKKAGIKNINADIIFGSPQDNWKLIRSDLTKIINMGVTHLSVYSLILEEKTILYYLFQKNQFQPMNPDTEALLYNKIKGFLKKYGFKQYETSNFALKGKESIHNLTYWNNESYAGIGSGASYYIDYIRYTNIKNLNSYFKGVSTDQLIFEEQIVITKEEQMMEEMMLGLRKTEGVSLRNFQDKYHCTIEEAFPKIKQLIREKKLFIKKNHIIIPESLQFVANSILMEFV